MFSIAIVQKSFKVILDDDALKGNAVKAQLQHIRRELNFDNESNFSTITITTEPESPGPSNSPLVSITIRIHVTNCCLR